MLAPAHPGAADWVVERWGEFGELVPRGFAACARLFHPASLAGAPVTWAEIARAMGTTAHANMDFEQLLRRREFDWQPEPGVFDRWPDLDAVPITLLPALTAILAKHTDTADRCVFAIWEGHGGMPDEVRNAPQLRLPGRNYHLYAGSIDDATGVVLEDRWGTSRYPPAYWWPDDRAWFVGSDTDLTTSFIAGTPELVADLLEEPGLETFEVAPDTGYDHRRDDVNPLGD